MNLYAVVATGGKQYLVHPEDTLQVELLRAEAGAEIELKPVLAVSDGTTLTVGRPHLENASVKAVVVKHIRGPKVISFKMKRRKGYHRKKGHRQELTVLQIKGIKP
ncbi:MAG: 50S ribosomal protein L21 [Kiritimatiellia bacterium]|nr:50S ribosomal protein L21 [Kiritimatiellia bacterium]